ncbi:hypothetical protein RHRU231_800041 [Rhodococcus ruber]|uniref:Uncharacterized protein n=1 Tax=Rhodococcus ruber TaxID=1830 RepID=A0A098BQX3_9NOCA|nr:hypothetical protein RHRU231_800041 [Rhodococcus ruber]
MERPPVDNTRFAHSHPLRPSSQRMTV